MVQTRLDRALIRVSGPDAHAFLQGLLTQNVENLSGEPVLYSGLLTPQGKVIADMFLWADEGGAVIVDAAASRAEDLLRRLTLYKLRANVAIEPLTDRRVMIDDSAFDGAYPDPRLAALGWRALAASDKAQHAPTDLSAFNAKRIALGVPDLAAGAAPEEAFALEALFEELNGVDFQKGCFVGQENVSRMKRRATTRKKFCPIAYQGAPLPPGATVRAGEADLGAIRASMAGQALALLRLDRAQEAQQRGVPLLVGDQEVKLAPPPWLILPPSS